MKFFKNVLVLFLVGGLLLGCSDTSPKKIPLSDLTKEDVVEKPSLTVYNPKVDILFVIDNSGSMNAAQANLARNARIFADEMSRVSALDYHIGVLTTTMDGCRADDCGRLVGYPRFVDKNTPNMAMILADKMEVGTNGSPTEVMFSPVIAALSPPLENNENVDFFRPGAFLAVIFITDAMEQSRYTPNDLYQFLLQKKGDAQKVLGYGVIRKLAEQYTCTSGSETLDGKLEEFLKLVVNGSSKQENILSLCATDYGVKLAEFAKDIVKRSSGTIKLSRLPDVKTIKVTYGTQVIPNNPIDGWVYVPSTNSILLNEGIIWDDSQPQGTGILVDFKAIEL